MLELNEWKIYSTFLGELVLSSIPESEKVLKIKLSI
jgi:hypothetical protein